MGIFKRGSSGNVVSEGREVDDLSQLNKKENKLQKAPFFIKVIVNIKILLSRMDPFRTTLILILTALFGFMIMTILLPWLQIAADIPNKIPILSLISGVSIGFFIADYQGRNRREGLCELVVGAKTHVADNKKVEILPGGSELIYLTTKYGKPLINTDDTNIRRWGKQRCLIIPKQVLEQFGSIRGRRAKSYPDCRLKQVFMKDIDLGISYIPRKVSETRLIKQLENAEQQILVLDEMMEKFKENARKIASDAGEFESQILSDLVGRMTKLQEAFWTDKVKSMVNEQMYKSRYYGRTPFSRRNYYDRGSPDWSGVGSSYNPGGENQND